MDLLLKISDEIREVNPGAIQGDEPAVFANSIISGVDSIKKHKFNNVEHEISCIWRYSDQIIRYLGKAEYTIIG